MNKIKISALVFIAIIAHQTYTNNFVKLIINNSPYFVTIQSTDSHSGSITLTNGWPYNNSQARFDVNEIKCIDYLIPIEKWGTRLFIEVFNTKQTRNDDGSYQQNLGQRIAWASILEKYDDYFKTDMIQIDTARQVGHGENDLSYGLTKILPKNNDLALRVIIDEDGSVRLAE